MRARRLPLPLPGIPGSQNGKPHGRDDERDERARACSELPHRPREGVRDGGFVEHPPDALAPRRLVDDDVFDPGTGAGGDAEKDECEGADDARLVPRGEKDRRLGVDDLLHLLT